jgi:hypothetical protein
VNGGATEVNGVKEDYVPLLLNIYEDLIIPNSNSIT